jgi:hypothetical protein
VEKGDACLCLDGRVSSWVHAARRHYRRQHLPPHGIPEEGRFVERGHGSDYSGASIDVVDGGGNHKDSGNSGGASFGQRQMSLLLDSYPRTELKAAGSYATTHPDLDSHCLSLLKIFPPVHDLGYF